MATYWYDAAAEAAVAALGTYLSGGSLVIFAGTAPTAPNDSVGTGTDILATLTLSSSGSSAMSGTAASNGTVTGTFGTITSGTAANTGTATYFAMEDSSGTVAFTGTCGASGANLNLNSTSITSGATVSCSSFTITLSETGT